MRGPWEPAWTHLVPSGVPAPPSTVLPPRARTVSVRMPRVPPAPTSWMELPLLFQAGSPSPSIHRLPAGGRGRNAEDEFWRRKELPAPAKRRAARPRGPGWGGQRPEAAMPGKPAPGRENQLQDGDRTPRVTQSRPPGAGETPHPFPAPAAIPPALILGSPQPHCPIEWNPNSSPGMNPPPKSTQTPGWGWYHHQPWWRGWLGDGTKLPGPAHPEGCVPAQRPGLGFHLPPLPFHLLSPFHVSTFFSLQAL